MSGWSVSHRHTVPYYLVIGEARISCRQVILVQVIFGLNQRLIGIHGVIITLEFQVGFRQAKACSVAARVKLNSLFICANSFFSFALEGAPGTQVFPGLGIIGSHAYDTLIGISGLVGITHGLVNCRQSVIDGPVFRIKYKHLVSNGKGLIILTHCDEKVGEMAIPRGTAW